MTLHSFLSHTTLIHTRNFTTIVLTLVILHILSPVTVFFGPHISDGRLTRRWCDLVETLGYMRTEPLRGVITRGSTMMLHDCPARFDGLEFRMILGRPQDAMASRLREAV